MKFIKCLFLLFLFTKQSVGQQNHFIYIQTENKQPFYVRLSDRLLNSSSSGYLVVPKLKDSVYELNVGFPKNQWPLQKITVEVKNKDAGYVLKNFDSKGWGLFNMQTMDVIMSSANNVSKDPNKETSQDGFADVLADVVSTPSIKQKPVSKEVKDVAVVKTEPVATSVSKTDTKEEKPVVDEPPKPAVKLSSTLDKEGRAMVYADTYDNKVDTILVFIPYEVIAEPKLVIEKPAEVVKKEEPKQESKQDAKFLDMELPNPNSKVDSLKVDKPVVSNEVDSNQDKAVVIVNDTEPKMENKAVIMMNSDCKLSASEDDFLKLRKKMAAEKTDDEMIAVAKKAFKGKCYSTEQVSNLSALFLKDDGRYNFFDAAYPRVSDTQNFGRLVTKLTDEYYITRFKAMIRH